MSAIIFKAQFGDDLRRWTTDQNISSYDQVVDRVVSLFSIPVDDFLIRYQDDDQDWITMTSDDDLVEAISVATACTESGKKPILRITITHPRPGNPQPVGSTRLDFAELERTQQMLTQTMDALEAMEAAKKKVEEELQEEKTRHRLEIAALEKELEKRASQKSTQRKPEQQPTQPDAAPLVEHRGVACDLCNMMPVLGRRFKKKGANYDLCHSCFEAIEPSEQANFLLIEHPKQKYSAPRAVPERQNAHKSFAKKPQARFVQHVNIPDNTEILPGTNFTKMWRLRNTGTEPWPAETQLIFVAGDRFEGDTAAGVGQSVPAGSEIDVAVSLVAPSEPGRYVSYWRLMVPPNKKFGQRIWVQVIIVHQDGTVAFDESEQAVHPSVECDVSGMFPLVGSRYHKKGQDFDLCEAEFLKLPDEEKAFFERIDRPGDTPVDIVAEFSKHVELPDEVKDEVQDELEARHGWATEVMQSIAELPCSGILEQLQATLTTDQFAALAAALEPVFQLPPEVMQEGLEELESPLTKLTKDPSWLVQLPERINAVLAKLAKGSAKKAKAAAKVKLAEAQEAKRQAKAEGDNEKKAEAKTKIKQAKEEAKAADALKTRSAWMSQPYTTVEEAATQPYAVKEEAKQPYALVEEETKPYVSGDEQAMPYAISEAVPEPEPRSVQEALAEMGIAQADLSASQLADIEQAVEANVENDLASAILQSQADAQQAAEEEIQAEVQEVAEIVLGASNFSDSIPADVAGGAETEAAAEAATDAEAQAEETTAVAFAEAEAAPKAEAEQQRLLEVKEAASVALVEADAVAEMPAAETPYISHDEMLQEIDQISADFIISECDDLYPTLPSTTPSQPEVDQHNVSQVEQLMAMGFAYSQATSAITANNGDLEAAVMMLLSAAQEQVEQPEPEQSKEPADWNPMWDGILEELKEMGFEDEGVNRALLIEMNGDVKDAVRELVNHERSLRN